MNPVRLIPFMVVLCISALHGGDGRSLFPKFSLCLRGTAGLMAIGDINTGLRTFNDNPTFEYLRKNDVSWGRIEGEVETLHGFYGSWEVEMRVGFSRRISVGVATSSAVHRMNEGSVTWTYLPPDQTVWPYHYYYRPEIRAAMPLKASVYYCLNPESRISSGLFMGLGYYRGRMSQQLNLDGVNGLDGEVDWSNQYWETQSKGGLGFHMGWEAEYRLARRVSVTADLEFRYAKIRNFRATQVHDTSFPERTESSGWLYTYTTFDPFIEGGPRYWNFQVWETPPDRSLDFKADIRRASLDLSGLAIKVGVRIGLF
jgi:hypothetical protein